MFKHIVVGCDGRPEGRDAVALGAAIAAATGGRLSLGCELRALVKEQSAITA